jgi:hypothetical protein
MKKMVSILIFLMVVVYFSILIYVIRNDGSISYKEPCISDRGEFSQNVDQFPPWSSYMMFW